MATAVLFPALLAILALLLVLPVASAIHKAFRDRSDRRAAERATELRPLLASLVLESDAAEARRIAESVSRDELIDAAGRLLPNLRGEDRARLSDALTEAGVIAHAIADTSSARALSRARAAHLLGVAGSGSAVPELTQLLDDPEEDVRIVAARALGRIGDPRGASALVASLSGPRPLSPGVVGMALVRLGAVALPALRTAVEDHDHWRSRQVAADVLGQLGDVKGAPALIGALTDTHAEVRIAAAGALRRIGSPRAVPALAAALGDSTPGVRAAAAEALGALEPGRAVAELEVALGDGEHVVARAAAFALATISEGAGILRRASETGAAGALEAREALAGGAA